MNDQEQLFEIIRDLDNMKSTQKQFDEKMESFGRRMDTVEVWQIGHDKQTIYDKQEVQEMIDKAFEKYIGKRSKTWAGLLEFIRTAVPVTMLFLTYMIAKGKI